jgi:hypothetical protein
MMTDNSMYGTNQGSRSALLGPPVHIMTTENVSASTLYQQQQQQRVLMPANVLWAPESQYQTVMMAQPGTGRPMTLGMPTVQSTGTHQRRTTLDVERINASSNV